MRLERFVRSFGEVPVATEELGEDGDLGLAHGPSDVLLRIVPSCAGARPTASSADWNASSTAPPSATVVPAMSRATSLIGGVIAVTSCQVCSAMAGERVIPRPAGR